ncbi:hypothetical protein [Litoribacillus peritrichatus]|uniref:Uncharacterized protein n=1 Tax=Litoribacillus peritrichatus TaxID=718191 RepID=A0ABP7MEV5_9GAMM
MLSLKGVVLGVALAVSGAATAGESYVCINGADERKISVVYTEPGSPVPCEVVYEKSSGMTTLWNAQSEEGYCEEKAKAFAEKQATWGYECTSVVDTTIGSAN